MNNKNNTHGGSHGLLTVLVLVSLVINAFSLYFLTGNSISLPGSKDATGSGVVTSIHADTLGIKKAILEIEYAKVGGKENYDLINEAQMIQLNETMIPQIKEYLAATKGKGGTEDTPVQKTQEPFTEDNITIPSVDESKVTIKDGTVLEGNPDAQITVIEYSDTECPYCIKQYHTTQIKKQLLAKYGDKVNFAFKNSRGVNHAGTTPKAIAALCAKKVGGAKAYVAYYETIMNMSRLNPSTGRAEVAPVSLLPSIAKKMGLDMSQWQACYDNKETMSEFEKETGEAESYGLRGTPGTYIINNATQKTATVAGAYPISEFINKVDELMK